MAKVVKLQREPLTKRAVQAIREAIFAGEYKPGERMVEEDLAVSLGVSRNVVREAFWQLEAQGLIHNDDYRGKSLTALTVADMIEMIPLRVALESMAASLAARKVTPQDAVKLRKHMARFTQGIKTFPVYVELDYELHQMIWNLAGNRHMELMLDRIAGPMIALQTRVHELDLGTLIRKETEAREGSHARIVEAICGGDKAKAQLAMQKHVLDFWHLWLQQARAAGAEEPDSQESIYNALNLVARWASILDPSGEQLPKTT